ncbi:MAG: diguanylate cyclase [Acidimicrobiales bacterium]|nr:diguanylate cyclase [Acidimicrobiales bacterium]
MSVDRVLRVVAAAAAAFGVYAVVTGEPWAAVAGGLCAVASASIALRAPRPAQPPDPDGPEVLPDGPEVLPEPDLATPIDADAPRLLSAEFVNETLRSRLAVARRALRPVSVVHVELLVGDGDGPAVPIDASVIAAAVERSLRESDVVGRREDDVYVFILEDTGEDGAVWTTERLRRHLAETVKITSFRAGVAAYPNHGLDADTIDARAAEALAAAREWRQDRIEVAVDRSSSP